MIDSTPLSVVVDQSPAGTAQLVVEADACSQAEKALQYALVETGQGACSVAFQGEDVLAGVENGFDPLAKRSKMRTFSGLVPTLGPNHGSLQVLGGRGELPARVPLVGKEDLPSFALAHAEEFESHLPFVPFGRAKHIGPRSAIACKHAVQAHAPEVAGVTRTVAVVTDIGKGRPERRLPASSALNWGRVDEQEVVVETGALLAKEDQEPAKNGLETAPALEVAGLSGDEGEEMLKRRPRSLKETPVRGDAHDGLGHREGDDLGVGGKSAGVGLSFWQKIIGCAINEGAEGVEVGVHRGLRAGGVSDTADFGPSASNPFCSAIFVESII